MSEPYKFSIYWVISHFVFGVVVSWVVFELVVGESRANKYEAHLATVQTENVLYREKLRFMEEDARKMRSENDRLLIWLQSKPDTIPYYEKQIENLTKENRELNDKVGMFQKKVTPPGWTAIGTQEKNSEDLYVNTRSVKVGESIEDGVTSAAVALVKVNADFSADITMRLPGVGNKQIVGIKSGASWSFEAAGKKYRLTLSKVDWYSQSGNVEIRQISIN